MTKTVEGSKMRLYFDRSVVENELLLFGERESHETAFIKNRYSEFDEQYGEKIVVLDIGANVGYYALLAANVFNDAVEIHAYEPEPGNVDVLETNINLNGYQNINTHTAAIGAEIGDAELAISSKANLHTLADLSRAVDANRITVPQKTVDSVISERPNQEGITICRIDVEGFEKQVFEGMQDLLNSDSDVFIFLEMHSNLSKQDVAWIRHKLESTGFEIELVSRGDCETWPVGQGYHVAASRIH